MPVVRTDGRSVGVRSRDYQIFSDGYMTSFSYPWCSAGALRARELRYKLLDKDKCDIQQLFTEEEVASGGEYTEVWLCTDIEVNNCFSIY